MSPADVMWAALFSTLGAVLTVIAGVEGWTLRNGVEGDTISESTRRRFQVHTPAGRRAFVLVVALVWSALTGLAAWFLPHILGG